MFIPSQTGYFTWYFMAEGQSVSQLRNAKSAMAIAEPNLRSPASWQWHSTSRCIWQKGGLLIKYDVLFREYDEQPWSTIDFSVCYIFRPTPKTEIQSDSACLCRVDLPQNPLKRSEIAIKKAAREASWVGCLICWQTIKIGAGCATSKIHSSSF